MNYFVKYFFGTLEGCSLFWLFFLYSRLNIDKDDDRKMFVIDFGLKIEIGGNSIIDDYLLEKQDVPIPICNENFTLPGTAI